MRFDMLYESDVWIGDSGASSHSTNNKTGAVNEQQFGSASLGHTRKAVKATSTFHMSGRFVTRDGTSGLKATLINVNYNDKLNFNLISLTWLLCSGWNITQGNAAGIILTNGSGGVTNFDIVIPTALWVHLCMSIHT